MALDGDASHNAPSPANAVSTPPAYPEAGPSRKGSIAKRVGFIFNCLSNFCFSLSFQTLEKRPEVRLIEYADVPGMTICPLLFYAQELAAKRFKKLKPSVLAPGTGYNSACPLHFTSSFVLCN